MTISSIGGSCAADYPPQGEFNINWLFLVFPLGSEEDTMYEPVLYASEKECIAAAQELVRQHPAFEWRDHRHSNDLIAPVLRPYVKCQENRMPADEEDDGTVEKVPKT